KPHRLASGSPGLTACATAGGIGALHPLGAAGYGRLENQISPLRYHRLKPVADQEAGCSRQEDAEPDGAHAETQTPLHGNPAPPTTGPSSAGAPSAVTPPARAMLRPWTAVCWASPAPPRGGCGSSPSGPPCAAAGRPAAAGRSRVRTGSRP